MRFHHSYYIRLLSEAKGENLVSDRVTFSSDQTYLKMKRGKPIYATSFLRNAFGVSSGKQKQKCK
jgi:hypothetical protein